MNECVQRWRDNRPLTSAEKLEMRIGAGIRLVAIVIVLTLVALALCGCQSAQALTFQAKGQFPAAEVPEAEQTFEGVTIVVAVETLTEFAPELRAKAAREADRVLRELAERKLPGKVRTRLIAEVAEPYSFRNIEAATGMSARPVLIQVLVPATNRGLTVGLILKKVEELVSSHFLEVVQRYQIAVTFQRTEPETYQIRQLAATMREPPSLPGLQAPDPIGVPPAPSREVPEKRERSGLLLTMLVAWLTERSKLAAKIVGFYRATKERLS